MGAGPPVVPPRLPVAPLAGAFGAAPPSGFCTRAADASVIVQVRSVLPVLPIVSV